MTGPGKPDDDGGNNGNGSNGSESGGAGDPNLLATTVEVEEVAETASAPNSMPGEMEEHRKEVADAVAPITQQPDDVSASAPPPDAPPPSNTPPGTPPDGGDGGDDDSEKPNALRIAHLQLTDDTIDVSGSLTRADGKITSFKMDSKNVQVFRNSKWATPTEADTHEIIDAVNAHLEGKAKFTLIIVSAASGEIRVSRLSVNETAKDEPETKVRAGVTEIGIFDDDGVLIKGKKEFPDGTTLQGEFDPKTGYLIEGTITSPDGTIREGKFDPKTGELIEDTATPPDDDEKEKIETRQRDNGVEETGFFNEKDILIEGTKVFLSGETQKGKFDPETGNLINGTVTFPDGVTWKGTCDPEIGRFIKGKKEFPDGTTLQGEFDPKTGYLIEGTVTSPDREKQKGKFDPKTGRLINGTITFPDGVTWKGTCDPETGKLIEGTVTSPDGKVRKIDRTKEFAKAADQAILEKLQIQKNNTIGSYEFKVDGVPTFIENGRASTWNEETEAYTNKVTSENACNDIAAALNDGILKRSSYEAYADGDPKKGGYKILVRKKGPQSNWRALKSTASGVLGETLKKYEARREAKRQKAVAQNKLDEKIYEELKITANKKIGTYLGTLSGGIEFKIKNGEVLEYDAESQNYTSSSSKDTKKAVAKHLNVALKKAGASYKVKYDEDTNAIVLVEGSIGKRAMSAAMQSPKIILKETLQVPKIAINTLKAKRGENPYRDAAIDLGNLAGWPIEKAVKTIAGESGSMHREIAKVAALLAGWTVAKAGFRTGENIIGGALEGTWGLTKWMGKTLWRSHSIVRSTYERIKQTNKYIAPKTSGWKWYTKWPTRAMAITGATTEGLVEGTMRWAIGSSAVSEAGSWKKEVEGQGIQDNYGGIAGAGIGMKNATLRAKARVQDTFDFGLLKGAFKRGEGQGFIRGMMPDLSQLKLEDFSHLELALSDADAFDTWKKIRKENPTASVGSSILKTAEAIPSKKLPKVALAVKDVLNAKGMVATLIPAYLTYRSWTAGDKKETEVAYENGLGRKIGEMDAKEFQEFIGKFDLGDFEQAYGNVLIEVNDFFDMLNNSESKVQRVKFGRSLKNFFGLGKEPSYAAFMQKLNKVVEKIKELKEKIESDPDINLEPNLKAFQLAMLTFAQCRDKKVFHSVMNPL